ncbi:helix-turn-helix transcriptional regulator [Salinarimonas sp.]|uniref:helix-turn-helix transcriptional regulator n=1 Tax=Salinarimonas sp. TaxID=2766526 RepID=UPI0032D91A0C
MGRATDIDLARIKERLYAAAQGAESWSDTLAEIASAARAERVTLHVLGGDGDVVQDSWPVAPGGVLDYVRDYADRDLRVARVLAGRRGVMSTEELLTAAEIARCPVHQEFYRAWPECWHSLMAPTDCETVLVTPTFHRGARHGPFEDEQRRVMADLAGHVAQAVVLRSLGAAGAGESLALAFDALPEAVFVLDGLLRVVFVNRRGRALLGEARHLTMINGALTPVDPAARAGFDVALAAALRVAHRQAADAAEMRVVLPGPRGRVLVATALPAPGRSPLAAVIRVRDPLDARLPPVSVVQAALGVSATEARVALALAKGSTAEDIARLHGISEHTARTHVRNLRGKIGAARQTEIVAAVMRLVE